MTKTKSKAQPEAAAGHKAPSKLGAMVALMQRPEGATLAVMQEATGWQAHSVRGAMSGSIKKKMGLTIASEKVDGHRTYRIQTGAGA